MGRGGGIICIELKGKIDAPTSFRSSSAMRGAEFHGKTCRDGQTRIRSILLVLLVARKPIMAQRETSPKPAREEKARIILRVPTHMAKYFSMTFP